jgi:predicted Zn-dependent protease with MMP-like domain
VSDEVFDRLDALADEGDIEGVEAEALRAIRKAEDPRDLWRYVAWARFELNRLEPALEAARTAEDPLLEGKALFHLWRFDEAAEAFDRFEGGAEEEAEVEWYRGVLAEFRGGDATRHFRRASKLAPDMFQEPVRLTDAQIDEVVRKAREELPPAVARAVEETTIEILPLPNLHKDVDPLSLGLYTGRDLMSRSIEESAMLPPKIDIFRKNIERIARDRAEAIDELRITLLHEIGHHVGMDEEQIEDAGYG